MAFQIQSTDNSLRFAKGEIAGVRGERGAGFHRLAIDLDFTVDPYGDAAPRITDLVADVRGHGNQLIGRALPAPGHLPVRASSYVSSPRVTLEIDLSRTRLEAIENIRNGGDLQLNLSLHYSIEGPPGNTNQRSTQASTAINQGVWVRVLEQLGYSKTLLIEVPAPDRDADPALAEAISQLQKAQSDLALGDYRDAIGSCRDVLDELDRAFRDGGADLGPAASLFQGTRAMGKSERIRVLRRALRLVTHPAKHRDEVAVAIDYDRRDAISVVTMTAALMGGLPRVGGRQGDGGEG